MLCRKYFTDATCSCLRTVQEKAGGEKVPKSFVLRRCRCACEICLFSFSHLRHLVNVRRLLALLKHPVSVLHFSTACHFVPGGSLSMGQFGVALCYIDC